MFRQHHVTGFPSKGWTSESASNLRHLCSRVSRLHWKLHGEGITVWAPEPRTYSLKYQTPLHSHTGCEGQNNSWDLVLSFHCVHPVKHRSSGFSPPPPQCFLNILWSHIQLHGNFMHTLLRTLKCPSPPIPLCWAGLRYQSACPTIPWKCTPGIPTRTQIRSPYSVPVINSRYHLRANSFCLGCPGYNPLNYRWPENLANFTSI